MRRSTKVKYQRNRKPMIVLICEGKNKTERLFFSHFNKRENKFNLKILDSEATDPQGMADKAKYIIEKDQLESSIGDRVFCVLDLDLSDVQLEKIKQEQEKKRRLKCKIEFIISNPCFEIFLLFYFTKHPKVESSSQKVKEQLKHYVPNYSESYDIIKECSLENQLPVAINNAELRNQLYSNDVNVIDKNPYTEVPDLLDLFFRLNNV